MNFKLHERLAADCVTLGDLPLCRVLLMNDASYPWLILVPRRPAIREVYELPFADQAKLWTEVSDTGQRLMQSFSGHKLNIGALGNMVPQLHLHVIVRQPDDAAWPGPVWGAQPAQPYTAAQLSGLADKLKLELGLS